MVVIISTALPSSSEQYQSMLIYAQDAHFYNLSGSRV